MRRLLVLVLTLALLTGSAFGSLAFWQALLGGGSFGSAASSANSESNAIGSDGLSGGVSFGLGIPRKQVQFGVGYSR